MPPTVPVLDTPITALSFDAHVTLMLTWAARRESRMVCAANVHMVMEAQQDPTFAHVLHQADLVTPDGTPLVWLMRLMGRREQERVAGMDLLPELCRRAEAQGLAVYFLGSTPEVLERMATRLAAEYPGLRVAGMESPPFRPLTSEEDRAQTERINASGAHLVLVALGCPKQERWMAAHRDQIQGVMVGLGGAFPVFARLQARAPELVCRMGLEWVFRLSQEPERLWRRYWRTNLPFMWRALCQLSARALPDPGRGRAA